MQENVYEAQEENRLANNDARLIGSVVSGIELSHTSFSERIFTFTLSVPRLTQGVFDEILVEFPERLCRPDSLHEGMNLDVRGQFRSYNQAIEGQQRSKLKLSLFAEEIRESRDSSPLNEIILHGTICRQPNLRVTPRGRDICDFLLAVERVTYRKSDYIPCIGWGWNAKYLGMLSVGDPLSIMGRIQSRDYTKNFEDGTSEVRRCYEVSINEILEAEAQQSFDGRE